MPQIGNSSSPAMHARAVTPSDSVNINARALYVGVTGNVAVLTSGGDAVTFTAVPAGGIIPVNCQRVLSTGTTATSIVALY